MNRTQFGKMFLAMAAVIGMVIPAQALELGSYRLLKGNLTLPSRQAPVAIAADYLQAVTGKAYGAAMLQPVQIRSLPSGSLVRFAQTFAGLEVVGGDAVVRVGPKGRVLWAKTGRVGLGDNLSLLPALTVGKAISQVLDGPAKLQGLSTLDPAQAKLVIWAPPNRAAHLAYRVIVPRNLQTLQTLRVYVDAHTGKILSTENLVKRAKMANVFEYNPIATPDIMQVSLNLPDGATTLTNDDAYTLNCVDQQRCMDFGMGFFLHMCSMVAVAEADDDGDFLHYTRPESDTDPEDSFAEIQMFYHVSKAYTHYRSLGFEHLASYPLMSVVNLRIPSFDQSAFCTSEEGPNDSALYPFDNAMFMPAGGLGSFPENDAIVFGQGSVSDFAYDGDVIYHEFGHAVTFSISSLGSALDDEFGIDPTPAGMHEGYADYFSASLSNDPEVGEYAGMSLSADGIIRSLENDKTCPESITGESHYDSEVWSGALWEIRKALVAEGHEAHDVDLAVYTAISGLSEFDNFDTAQQSTTAELIAAFDQAAGDIAAAVFTARGLDGCNGRVIDFAFEDDKKELIYLYGTDAITVSEVPGPMQFKLELTEDAEAIVIDAQMAQSAGMGFGGPTEPSIKLLVKSGDDAIAWTYTNQFTHDATDEGLLTIESNMAHGEVIGTFPAGVYHVQLVNAGPTYILAGVSFSYLLEVEIDGGPQDEPITEPDGGTEPDAGPAVDDDTPPKEDSSGGCSTSNSTPTNGAIFFMLAMLGVLIRRQKSA